MVNDVQWVSSDYQVTRTPDEKEMTEIANQFLEAQDHWKINEQVPIVNGHLTTDNFKETGMISFSWSRYTQYMHGSSNSEIYSEWVYDETADSWIIAVDEDAKDTYVADLRIFESGGYPADVEANFNGVWPTITITNFSEKSMDVTWGDGSGHFEHILSTTSQALAFSGNDMRWYLDENGNYLSMCFDDDKTTITIQSVSGHSVYCFAIEFISDDLPPL